MFKRRKPRGPAGWLFLQLVYLVFSLKREVRKMAGELERLTTEVSENTEVVNSAVLLIEGLAQQIRDLANDPAALNKLADDLDESSNKLASAVADNTPSQP